MIKGAHFKNIFHLNKTNSKFNNNLHSIQIHYYQHHS